MPTKILQHLESQSQTAIDSLTDFLRIPSISADRAYDKDCVRCAQWIAQQFRSLGLEVIIHDTPGQPIVTAKPLDQDVLNPNAPRILYYGHYDVQPPDPLELWQSPPFEPAIVDGAIVARGASDDKGQVCCILEALRAWKNISGKFPAPFTLLIEGEEESGSENLQAFIKREKDYLKADVCIISDTSLWDIGDQRKPAITYALRGLVYFDIKLHGPNRDLHSGVYGGTLANPANILTRILGRLQDDDNKITIPHFYDDVQPTSDQVKSDWQKLGFKDEQFLGPLGVQAAGEATYTTLERRWTRPACDINGIYGGYAGQGAKTVIPAFAGAKVSFRIPAAMQGDKVAKQFEAWLRSQNTHGLTWEITNLGHCNPVAVPTDSPFMTAAKQAIFCASGEQAVVIAEGATIPVVADFKALLAIDSLLVGFGLSDDKIHSPNEKFDLDCFQLGQKTHAAILDVFGKM